jgi:hypothetical protein
MQVANYAEFAVPLPFRDESKPDPQAGSDRGRDSACCRVVLLVHCSIGVDSHAAGGIEVFPLQSPGRFVVLADVVHELFVQVIAGIERADADDVALNFGQPVVNLF